MLSIFAAVSPPSRASTLPPGRPEGQRLDRDRDHERRGGSHFGDDGTPPAHILAPIRSSSVSVSTSSRSVYMSPGPTLSSRSTPPLPPSTMEVRQSSSFSSRPTLPNRSPTPTSAYAHTQTSNTSIHQALATITSHLMKNDTADRSFRRSVIDKNDLITEQLERMEEDSQGAVEIVRETKRDVDSLRKGLMSFEKEVFGRMDRMEAAISALVEQRSAQTATEPEAGPSRLPDQCMRTQEARPTTSPTAINVSRNLSDANPVQLNLHNAAEVVQPQPQVEAGFDLMPLDDEGFYDGGVEAFMDVESNGGDVPDGIQSVNPRDIMIAPEYTPTTRERRESSSMSRRFEEPVVAEAQHSRDQENDSGADEELVTPLLENHEQTSEQHPSGLQVIGDDDEEAASTTSKPPPRLPFPPRPNTASTTTPGRPRRAATQRKSLPSTNTPVSTAKKSKAKPNSTNYASSSRSVSSQCQNDDPQSQSQPPTSAKRKRTNRDLSLEDALVKKPKTTSVLRKFKGRTAMGTKYMPASDGVKKTDAIWPAKGENTRRGRLAEIICDVVSYKKPLSPQDIKKLICRTVLSLIMSSVAVGLAEDVDMTNETWICPDCKWRIDEIGTPRALVDTIQQVRCIRYNCILREKQAIVPDDGDPLYVVEKVVGRRATGRVPGELHQRTFEYLVKWEGYDMDECTWEPPDHLEPHVERRKAEFMAEAIKENLDTHAKVALLKEAWKEWDRVTGKAKGDKGRESSELRSEEGEASGEGRRVREGSLRRERATVAQGDGKDRGNKEGEGSGDESDDGEDDRSMSGEGDVGGGAVASGGVREAVVNSESDNVPGEEVFGPAEDREQVRPANLEHGHQDDLPQTPGNATEIRDADQRQVDSLDHTIIQDPIEEAGGTATADVSAGKANEEGEDELDED
ncbi:hypothetical protein CI109_100311 [Kwoniella shandongensis]|uniref:Uncharacterized protein n=1 Tax=Kwoniella shandongensis TaxID=1734106 RepID=A0A5M6C483_9TREE|nr:uncharacterized protein CI109_001844 [Kwoniella shandongensis]KAA5529904.1 hypothetical protein CI109_001844 [Kwoniella shandongensis]